MAEPVVWIYHPCTQVAMQLSRIWCHRADDCHSIEQEMLRVIRLQYALWFSFQCECFWVGTSWITTNSCARLLQLVGNFSAVKYLLACKHVALVCVYRFDLFRVRTAPSQLVSRLKYCWKGLLTRSRSWCSDRSGMAAMFDACISCKSHGPVVFQKSRPSCMSAHLQHHLHRLELLLHALHICGTRCTKFACLTLLSQTVSQLISPYLIENILQSYAFITFRQCE